MKKIAFAFIATAALFSFGCKKGGGGAAAEALGKIEGFSKAMCECKDKACGDKVNDEYTKWGTDMAKTAPAGKTDEKPDPELAKKMGEAVAKYGECFTKLAMAGAPKVDEPKKDEPKADEPKKDEPKADEPKKDEPKADEPKKDEPKKDDDKKPVGKKDDKKPDDKKAGGW